MSKSKFTPHKGRGIGGIFMSSKGKYTILPEVSDKNTGLSVDQLVEMFASVGDSPKKRKSKKKKGKKYKKLQKKHAKTLEYLHELNGSGKKGTKGKKKSKQSKQSKKKVYKKELKYSLIGKFGNEAIDLVAGIAKMYAISKLSPTDKKLKTLNVVSTQ